ncbi:uncharacterized protein LOC100181638 [Ciona intestinalis]
MATIPIVDFGQCSVGREHVGTDQLQKVGEEIYNAFTNVGFVYLVNTGIHSTSVDEVNKVALDFFTKPEVEKLKFGRSDNNFGYDSIGKEKLDDGSPGDYKLSFNMACRTYNDPNIKWPDELVPQFSSTVKSFMKDCKCLALRILDSLSFGLKLQDNQQLSALHESILCANNHSSLRCLYYPPITQELEKGQIRLLEHTDYGLMTLLFQDFVGGLQIKSRDGTYIDACPIPDTVLINVADLLQYWTHGDLKSTPHRILVPDDTTKRSTPRQSIAFFVHPSEDLLVSNTLFKQERKLTDETTLRNFSKKDLEKMTVGEYVQSQFNRTYTR